MSEPRRSTRARAREEAAPAPETPKETPVKGAKSSLKRKRPSAVAKASTPATDSPQGSKQTLPLRISDGQPLPTLPEPQPLELSSAEWQDIQQSGVLGASLDRSRAVWVSGVNFRVFHKHFAQPKKPADRTDEDKARNTRQKDLVKNFPELGRDASLKDAAKDTEVQAQLVIEPHTFPIRLFAPREIMKSQPKKVSAGPSYGAWPNHNQPQHSQPNQYTQYNSQGQPVYQPKPPQPRPPPPKPVQKAPAPAPGPASTPAPDPVIHMLAQRAGVDPELKSVMKIVAAGQASKEQLEFFQTHINELTAVLAKQKKEEAAKAAKLLPASATPKAVAPPPTPQPIAAPPPPPRPVQPAQPSQPLQQAPKPYIPAPPQAQIQQAPPMRPSQPPYPNTYNQHQQQQYHPPRQPPAQHSHQPIGYRPIIFSFEEGNKDLLHFPSYSFLEWLPNMSGAKISFLITKMKPKPEQDTVVKPPSTPAPNPTATLSANATAAATPNATTPNATTPNATTPNTMGFAQTPTNTFQVSTPSTPASFVPQPRIEDFNEKKDIADIEFYQPVTVLLLTDNNEIRSALVRAIRPPDVVEKYMDEIFDKCKRAGETYLAFRLPRDGDAETADKRARSGDITPASATPTLDRRFSGLGSHFGSALSALDKKKAGRIRRSLA